MNEPENFCSGVCSKYDLPDHPIMSKLPYIPTGRNLESKILPLDAYHADSKNTVHETHSVYSTLEVKATHDYFKSKNERAMVVSRSGFSGIGKYGFRHLGDNFST